jgi:hypothetical protein
MRGSRLRQGFAGHLSVRPAKLSEDGKPAHDEVAQVRLAMTT